MANDELPGEVQALLRERVQTYEQLEVVLLLCAQERSWTPEATAEKLSLPLGAASEALDRLCASGLLDVRIGGESLLFQYHPATPELARTVTQLARIYAEQPLAVVKLMSSNSVDRLRNSALHTFADAFLLGGKKNG